MMLNSVAVFCWLVVGLLAAWLLLWLAHQLPHRAQIKLLGRSLVVAALVYVFFALVWGNQQWLWIELIGVVVYALFYLAALKGGVIWLGLGWLLHPLWDLVLHLYGPGYMVAPQWYAWACLSFDLAVFGFIMVVLYSRKARTDLSENKVKSGGQEPH